MTSSGVTITSSGGTTTVTSSGMTITSSGSTTTIGSGGITISGTTSGGTATIITFSGITTTIISATTIIVGGSPLEDCCLWTAGTGSNAVKLIDNLGTASGDWSVSEGYQTTATGLTSHAEGTNTYAYGTYSHAEGSNTVAGGNSSHAEGGAAAALGDYSHAEGSGVAHGITSHAEGSHTRAAGIYTHAEGRYTSAIGESAHSEGGDTIASGYHSHAGGKGYNNITDRIIASGKTSFIHYEQTSATSSTLGAYGDNSAILGGIDHNLTSGATRSVILGGNAISATTSDTVYVPKLNIGTPLSTASVNNLGIDSSGFVTISDSHTVDSYTTGSTLVGKTVQFDSNIHGTNYYSVDLTPALSEFITGYTDSYTTGSTLVGNVIQFDSNIHGTNFYNVDLSSALSEFITGYTDTFVTGGTIDGSYQLTLDRSDGTNASPIDLSSLHDNVIVKYVTGYTQMMQAFTDFNATNTGGIIKLGNDIQLPTNTTLDFGNGIELWGGGNALICTSGVTTPYIITLNGTTGVMRAVYIDGPADLANDPTVNAMANTQHVLTIDDSSMKSFKFIECTINGCVGRSDYSASAKKYVLQIDDTAGDCFFEFNNMLIQTTATAVNPKPYDAFRIEYKKPSGAGGIRLMFKDWVNSGPANDVETTRFSTAKDSMEIQIDSTTNGPTYKRAFIYDQSVSLTPTSAFGSNEISLYPTFWGPTTKKEPVDPTVTATFGNPGDILITGTSAYMKVGEVSTAYAGDTDWIRVAAGESTYKTTTSLSTAQLGSLNTSPVILIPAPGVDKLIVPTQVVTQVTFGTAAFGTPRDVEFWYSGATERYASEVDPIMEATADVITIGSADDISTSPGNTQGIANAPLIAKTVIDAIVGTSTITAKITVYYHILDIS